MQFFIFDFALALAVLLGYRAAAAVVHRAAPLFSVPGGAAPQVRRITPNPKFDRRPGVVRPRAIERKPVAPTRAPQSEVPRAHIHRLINFW